MYHQTGNPEAAFEAASKAVSALTQSDWPAALADSYSSELQFAYWELWQAALILNRSEDALRVFRRIANGDADSAGRRLIPARAFEQLNEPDGAGGLYANDRAPAK